MQEVSSDSAITTVETASAQPPFRLRAEHIRAAINFKRENDPAFADLSVCDLADKCKVGHSTFKRILSGAAVDAACSTIAYICEGLGINPAVVMGLAPARDYQREKETYNPTLMDTLRMQNVALEERLGEKRQRIEELTGEVAEIEDECARLRRMYNEKCMALSAAEARLLSLQNDVDKGDAQCAQNDKTANDLRKDIEELKITLRSERAEHKKRMWLFVLTVALLIAALGIIIYLLWEMANPTRGRFRY